MKWQIGDVTIPNQVVVAPMAGITNAAFRVICKQFGAGLVVCEMVSDRAILHRNEKTMNMLTVDPTEHPMSIQLFGGSKETLVEAAKYIDKHTAADIIDINMGCPVHKITKTNSGSHWLLDPDAIEDVVSAVTAAVDKPVTVKMRTGWDDDHIYAVENALAAERGGAAAITMHGRTRDQMYAGHANWDILKEVKANLHVPFIGNGDVRTPEDAQRMLDYVGADAVMVGRAALGNPWVVKQMVEYLDDGKLLPEPSAREKIAIAKKQLDSLVDLKGNENVAVREFRKQAAYYLKGIPHAARTKAAVNEVETEAEVDSLLDDFVAKTEARAARKAAQK
ncbi:tRNA dihydrouridine synthase DusB [Lactobacillus selangorensis]|nr:tRNA dihydrouridine synthase DusB [Lactobacillus selangorensis]